MKIITDSGTWRDIRYGDEADYMTIVETWNHDGKRMNIRRAEQAIHKYANDMAVEPGDHPITADTKVFREAFILHEGTAPMAFLVYVVRGPKDPRAVIAIGSVMHIEGFAIAPAFQGQGRSKKLLMELINSCFTVMKPDILLYEYVDTPEMNAHKNDRDFTKSEETTGKDGKERTRVQFLKADYDKRMAERVDEAAVRTSFLMN